MKKKRWIGFILVLAMLFTGSVGVLAVDAEPTSSTRDYAIEQIGNRHIFAERTNNGAIAIVAKPSVPSIEFNYAPSNEDTAVYQLVITDIPASQYNCTSLTFWDSIISRAMNELEDASTIHIQFSDSASSRSISSPQTSDTSQAILNALQDTYGNEYAEIIDSTVYNGYDMDLEESLVYSVDISGATNWHVLSHIASAGSWLAKYLENKNLGKISLYARIAFIVLGGINDIVTQNGEILSYHVIARTIRKVYVEDTGYYFCTTSKSVIYDANLPADLTTVSLNDIFETETMYSPAEYAYNNYTYHYMIAYNNYEYYLETGAVTFGHPDTPVIA